MIALFALVLVLIIGFLYAIFSRKKLIYLNAPNDVIRDDLKPQILMAHVIVSIIIGVSITNIYLRNYHQEIFQWLIMEELLAISILSLSIISFTLLSVIIHIYLRQTNSYFNNLEYIKSKPEILIPEAYYISNESLNDDEFWQVISLLKEPEKFKHEINQRHPIWLVKLNHSLIEHKIKLIKNGLFPIARYVFNKYENEFHEEFCDYIVSLGKEDYYKILNNLDSISEYNLDDFFKKKNYLEIIVSETFLEKTGKILVPTKELPISSPVPFKYKKKEIRSKYPKTYSTFRK